MKRPKCSFCKKELFSGKNCYFDGRNEIWCSKKCFNADIELVRKRVEKLPLEKGMAKHHIEVISL